MKDAGKMGQIKGRNDTCRRYRRRTGMTDAGKIGQMNGRMTDIRYRKERQINEKGGRI